MSSLLYNETLIACFEQTTTNEEEASRSAIEKLDEKEITDKIHNEYRAADFTRLFGRFCM
jgi:hypothetical protein